MKACDECRESKPLGDFMAGGNGHSRACKDCLDRLGRLATCNNCGKQSFKRVLGAKTIWCKEDKCRVAKYHSVNPKPPKKRRVNCDECGGCRYVAIRNFSRAVPKCRKHLKAYIRDKNRAQRRGDNISYTPNHPGYRIVAGDWPVRGEFSVTEVRETLEDGNWPLDLVFEDMASQERYDIPAMRLLLEEL